MSPKKSSSTTKKKKSSRAASSAARPPVGQKPAAGKKAAASKKPAASKTTAAGKKKAASRKPLTAARKTGLRKAPVRTLPPEPPSPEARQKAADYQKALTLYAVCMQALQNKDWKAASRGLADFIASNTTERELSERARMYLRVCAQHLTDEDLTPKSFDECCHMAVIHANRGEYNRALRSLKKALDEKPTSDKALYLQASTQALKGDRKPALDSLKKAIARDDRNRIFAANDPDFSSLRDDEEFITLTTREDEDF